MNHLFVNFFILLFLSTPVTAQQKITNLIVVTTDGFRWQELFGGMDSSIAIQNEYNQGDSSFLFKSYWDKDVQARRQLLMPFFWNTLAKNGQIYGNRSYGANVNTANKYWFSYPGYNEIFTGYPDTLINSNQYPPNPHQNVLEFLNHQPAFKGKVIAFTAWEAFNRILNEGRSRFPVIAAFDTTNTKPLSVQQQLINNMLLGSYKPWNEDECLDVFTHFAAMEYLRKAKPKVLYISYGETDEWAHAGRYRDYLNAAHQVDQWLNDLWSFVQTTPGYKDQTALLITTDHGRGINKEWTTHGSKIKGADEIWFAVLAPGLPVKGEIKLPLQLYQQQLAHTMANLLGEEFKPKHPVAGSLITLLKAH